MTTSIKTCFKCGAEKPLTEFYKHSRMADGHLNKCKCCTKADAHHHRHHSDSRERVLAYDRERGCRQSSEYRAEHRKKYPVKSRARAMLRNAIRDGKIDKPKRCKHCHTEAKRICGHHEDYSKPLDVVWLCDVCHRQLHAFYETVGRVLNEPNETESADEQRTNN